MHRISFSYFIYLISINKKGQKRKNLKKLEFSLWALLFEFYLKTKKIIAFNIELICKNLERIVKENKRQLEVQKVENKRMMDAKESNMKIS